MPRDRKATTAKNISKLLAGSGKTQKHLARKIGVSVSVLRHASAGETRPSRETIWKIARYFQVHPYKISPFEFDCEDDVPWARAPGRTTVGAQPGPESDDGTVADPVPPAPPETRPIRPDPAPNAVSPDSMKDETDAEGQGGFQVLPAHGTGQVRVRMNMELSVDKMSRVLAAVTQ